MNRNDLIDQFGLSVNQESADVNRYIGFAPDNMVYDKSVRMYTRGPEYTQHFLRLDINRYQSLSHPEPSWRSIAPYAIGFDGFRWHTRARLADEAFKNFLFSRMLEIRESRASGVPAEDYHDWNTEVTLEIGPHSALSETQTQVIALDHEMRGGKTKIKFRRALLNYALRRLGHENASGARELQDQHIVLLNREAVSEDAR